MTKKRTMLRGLKIVMGILLIAVSALVAFKLTLLDSLKTYILAAFLLILGLYLIISALTKKKDKKNKNQDDIFNTEEIILDENTHTVQENKNYSRPTKIQRKPTAISSIQNTPTPTPIQRDNHEIPKYVDFYQHDVIEPRNIFAYNYVENQITQETPQKNTPTTITEPELPLPSRKTNTITHAPTTSIEEPEHIITEKKPTSKVLFMHKFSNREEAVNECINDAKNMVRLKIPDLQKIDTQYLNKLTNLDTKIIIQEFDKRDMEYNNLLLNLKERGIDIKTCPIVNTVELLVDYNIGLVVATDPVLNNEIGATYNDKESLDEIYSLFNKFWDKAQIFQL